jgi:hypothetical protein
MINTLRKLLGRRRSSPRLFATALAFSTLFLCRSSGAQLSEELYGVHGWPVGGLVRLDRSTGAVLEEHRVYPLTGFIYHGLAFDGSRFLSPAMAGALACYMIPVNPSKGFQGTPTNVVGHFYNMSMAQDPTTGRMWGVGQDLVQTTTQLWEFDPVTSMSSSHGLLGGATTFATGITFDQSGTCYITDALGPRVMTLDLNTRIATVAGTLQIGVGSFYDIAMSLNGEIWGAFQGAGPPAQPTGLYRFDTTSFTAVLVCPLIGAYSGLGFARYPSAVPICPGKVNSQGCVPQIEVEGFPSATGNLGFYVRATEVVNQEVGMLLIGVNGTASTPFGGGTLCIAPPYFTTLTRSSSGSSTGVDCSGIWQLDLEQEIRRREHLGLPPGFTAGQSVYLQWVGRDRALGLPNPVSISGATTVTLMP